jgi:hypothetical protein
VSNLLDTISSYLFKKGITMKKMFVIINHDLTQEQKDQAIKSFDIDYIINITDDTWSNIDPADENILYALNAYKKELMLEAEAGDIC